MAFLKGKRLHLWKNGESSLLFPTAWFSAFTTLVREVPKHTGGQSGASSAATQAGNEEREQPER